MPAATTAAGVREQNTPIPPHSGMTDAVLQHVPLPPVPQRALSETNNINREYEAAQYHRVFDTHGTPCASPRRRKKERFIYYGGEAQWYCTRSFPNTASIVFEIQYRDVRETADLSGREERQHTDGLSYYFYHR